MISMTRFKTQFVSLIHCDSNVQIMKNGKPCYSIVHGTCNNAMPLTLSTVSQQWSLFIEALNCGAVFSFGDVYIAALEAKHADCDNPLLRTWKRIANSKVEFACVENTLTANTTMAASVDDLLGVGLDCTTADPVEEKTPPVEVMVYEDYDYRVLRSSSGDIASSDLDVFEDDGNEEPKLRQVCLDKEKPVFKQTYAFPTVSRTIEDNVPRADLIALIQDLDRELFELRFFKANATRLLRDMVSHGIYCEFPDFSTRT